MRSTWLRRSPLRWLSLLPILSLSCVAFFIGFFVGVILFKLIFPPVIKWLKPLPDWLTFIHEYLLALTLICIMLSLPFFAMGKAFQWLMRGRAVLKNISVRRRFGEAIAPKITEDLFDPLVTKMRYILLEIDSEKILSSNSGINALPPIDIEAIMLLKMTCPV